MLAATRPGPVAVVLRPGFMVSVMTALRGVAVRAVVSRIARVFVAAHAAVPLAAGDVMVMVVVAMAIALSPVAVLTVIVTAVPIVAVDVVAVRTMVVAV